MTEPAANRYQAAPQRRTSALLVSTFISVQLVILGLALGTLWQLNLARAYATAEGLYAKSQKQALFELQRYAYTGSPESFQAYRHRIQVPISYNIARRALESKPPDLDAARRGFRQGGSHPDDIPGMISLYLWFQDMQLFEPAVKVWGGSETIIEEITRQAMTMHHAIRDGTLDVAMREQHLERIHELDLQITRLEDRFSRILGETTRNIRNAAFASLGVATIVLWTIGLWLGGQLHRRSVTAEAALLRDRRFSERRGEILERVARGEALSEIYQEVVDTIEAYHGHAAAAVIDMRDGVARVAVAPNLSDASVAAIDGRPPGELEQVASDTVREAGIAGGDELDRGEEGGQGTAVLRAALNSAGIVDLRITPVGNEDEISSLLALFTFAREEIGEEMSGVLVEMAQIILIARDHHDLYDRLLHQARYDQLTGLPNRSLLTERMQQIMLDANRARRSFALLLLDLDDFKIVNDTHGHKAGDMLLRDVAHRLQESLRASDIIARFGGDEFVVAAPLQMPSDAVDVAERIFAGMDEPFRVAGNNVVVKVSLGISVFPQDGETAEQLVHAADSAMYVAKDAGKNRYSHARETKNLR